jgi:hypothetical protein
MSDLPIRALFVLVALWTAAGVYGLATSATARERAADQVGEQNALETFQLCERLGLGEAEAALRCVRELITVVEDRQRMRASLAGGIF